MPSGALGQVTLIPDGAGKAIACVARTAWIEGVETTVYVQAMVLVDASGEVVDTTAADAEFRATVLNELRALRDGLQRLTGKTLEPLDPLPE